MFVIKFDGRKDEFQKNKIIHTCIKVGVPEDVANRIADKIESIAYDGITTKEIYKATLRELDKYEKKTAIVYGLRESIAYLEPMIFEVFVKRVLEEYGYRCEYNKIVHGLCVEHQIDITAKNDSFYLVECKRHKNPHRFSGLNVCLQVQARFEDIKDGFMNNTNNYNFERAWIVTNTKFSEHAKDYASAKNIRLTGWKYPKDQGLEKMIEDKKIYPVSILKTKKDIIQKLLNNGIITLKELDEERLANIGFKEGLIKNLIKQRNLLISIESKVDKL